MRVQRVRVTLEAVTPLFLGGVDPRGEPELRTPSIKGALRAWWRALYGGVHPHILPHQLATAEGKLFGSTENASPITLRLRADTIQTAEEWPTRQYFGIDYLFFAFRGTRRDPARKGFPPGQQFDLILQTRPGAKESEAEGAYKQACAALWLWVRFGALGARSRRGAGCLRAIDVDGDWPDGLPNLEISAQTAAEYLKESQAGLQALYDTLDWDYPTADDVTPSNFNILHPRAGHIHLLGRPFDSWEQALDRLGEVYQQFRSRYQPDYDNVKAAVSGRRNQMNPVERAAFGLPIVFYYRSLGGQRGTLEGETTGRRSSPLAFHVTRLANGQYLLTLIYFRAQLLPTGTGLKLSRRGRPVIADPPGDSLMGQFIIKISRKEINGQPNELFIANRRAIPFPGGEK
ncbi:MAG: type III-B CRISPR module RAMP protein Cmr1 [Chloroflexi bacterium]|nr:type III-B CRISPR module RAMP protein Cmr1 [Chloroflexota bacterium]